MDKVAPSCDVDKSNFEKICDFRVKLTSQGKLQRVDGQHFSGVGMKIGNDLLVAAVRLDLL